MDWNYQLIELTREQKSKQEISTKKETYIVKIYDNRFIRVLEKPTSKAERSKHWGPRSRGMKLLDGFLVTSSRCPQLAEMKQINGTRQEKNYEVLPPTPNKNGQAVGHDEFVLRENNILHNLLLNE